MIAPDDMAACRALIRTGNNDGEATVAAGPGTYTFRVCNKGSSVCSLDVGVTVNQ